MVFLNTALVLFICVGIFLIRYWTKNSHEELVKQSAILSRIEETLVRMEKMEPKK